MAKGDDIENRLVDFAVRIVNLSDSLYQECDELCRIINASIKTSRKNQNQTG